MFSTEIRNKVKISLLTNIIQQLIGNLVIIQGEERIEIGKEELKLSFKICHDCLWRKSCGIKKKLQGL